VLTNYVLMRSVGGVNNGFAHFSLRRRAGAVHRSRKKNLCASPNHDKGNKESRCHGELKYTAAGLGT
jgi:hypothetical protein